jgi:hypothetical protein
MAVNANMVCTPKAHSQCGRLQDSQVYKTNNSHLLATIHVGVANTQDELEVGRCDEVSLKETISIKQARNRG